MLRVCLSIGSIVQYVKHNLLLLAVRTFASELPLRKVYSVPFSSLLFGVFTDAWRSLP